MYWVYFSFCWLNHFYQTGKFEHFETQLRSLHHTKRDFWMSSSINNRIYLTLVISKYLSNFLHFNGITLCMIQLLDSNSRLKNWALTTPRSLSRDFDTLRCILFVLFEVFDMKHIICCIWYAYDEVWLSCVFVSVL